MFKNQSAVNLLVLARRIWHHRVSILNQALQTYVAYRKSLSQSVKEIEPRSEWATESTMNGHQFDHTCDGSRRNTC